MKARIATTLTVTSLVLCLFTCALWARSVVTADWITYSQPPQQFRLRTPTGRLELVVYDDYAGTRGWSHRTEKAPFDNLLASSDERFRALGFGYYTYNAGRKYSERTIVIPLWSLVLALVLLPAVSCLRRWSHRRRTLGAKRSD